MKLPAKITVPVRRLPRRPLINRRPVPPGALDPRDYVKRHAKDGEWSTLVTKPCILHDGRPENPTCIYLHLKDYGIDLTPLATALQRIKYGTADRTDGMQSTSRVFGYEPRRTLRKDFCAATALFGEDPAAHELLTAASGICDHFYRITNPVRYANHRRIADENSTIKQWLMPDDTGKGTVFTSGIINQNNFLPYHFDRGNIEDVWSAMLVFKGGGVEGGYLAVPEYDAAFELPDHSLFMFDGQGLMHGVTPIVRPTPAAWRYSIVYYSLKGMWQCLTPGSAELTRYQQIKWDRQVRRAKSGAPTAADEEE